MEHYPIAVVVLAAGRGTRMKSSLPKVMHKLAGKPMINHLLDTVKQMRPEHVITVVAEGMEDVREAAKRSIPDVKFAVQKERLGTASAVRTAIPQLEGFQGDVLVLVGDIPLVSAFTMRNIIMSMHIPSRPKLVVLGFRTKNPKGYGRMVVDSTHELKAIIEENEANDQQKKINLCNSGIMAIRGQYLKELLGEVDNHNSKGEYYLTDIVGIAARKGFHCVYTETEENEVMGINSRQQLSVAEATIQETLRQKAMDNGVTLIAPNTVFLSSDTQFGYDVVIHPNVVIGEGTVVGDYVEIKSFTHIEQSVVEASAVVGPYTRLRPGAYIQADAHIGNFVEIKNSTIESGAKVNHLSYIGDARIGERANIGAGTITCNYDGFVKSHTDIGKDSFIGSNTALVAPVSIGDGVMVGAGSVITEDVKNNALSLSRAKQETIPDKAREIRRNKSRSKKSTS